jgi:SAM-dependent methyltransferase
MTAGRSPGDGDAGDEATPSQPTFWEQRYESGRTGWELGRAAPPLVHHFSRHDVTGQRALVVGCGRGHEARLLAERGAAVVAVDFAPHAIAEARALTPAALLAGGHGEVAEGGGAVVPRAGTIDFRERDLFELGREPDRYDLVVEHCCFCAIEPGRRAEYVEVMAQVLFEHGQLVGLFRSFGKPGGPPYSIERGELEQCFAVRFDQLALTVPADSVPGRHNEELLGVFRRR